MSEHATDGSESSDSTECPTCGRTDFATRQGMKTHHKAIHGESIAGVTVSCAWCGDEKTVPPSRAEHSKRNFCNDKGCLHEWRSENRAGEDSWHWKGGEAELSCEVCGGSFSVPPKRSDTARFCSHDCFGEWYSGVNTGPRNGNWEGGEYVYGPGWSKAKRTRVRERDGNECQICGMTNEEHYQQYGWVLEVHHIHPARKFTDPEKRNATENLITYCRACHSRWEGIPLRPM